MPEVSPGLALLSRSCSVLLGVAAGTQAMIAGLLLIRREIDPILARRLTVSGRIYYRPEYDLPVYLAGCLWAVTLACGLTWVMARRSRRLPPDRAGSYLVNSAWRHIVLAATATVSFLLVTRTVPAPPDPNPVLRAELLVGPGTLAMLAALIGLLTDRGKRRLDPWRTAPTDSPFGSAWRVEPEAARQSWPAARGADLLLSGAVVVGIVSVVAITSCSKQVGVFSLDPRGPFHHWDFFVIGPALRYFNGGALGTDVYSQYGVAWPVVFAWLSPVLKISYANALAVFVWLGVAYFVGLFLGLRWFLGRTVWAATAVFAAILVQMFLGSPSTQTIWMTPSSTALRSPLDVVFFLALAFHQRSGKSKWAVAAGAIAAAGLLFETDTGVYLLATLAFYLACDGWCRSASPGLFAGPGGVATALAACLASALTVLSGLAVASRGDFLRLDFWAGWLEPLLLYGGGMSAIPFDVLDVKIFLIPCGTYLILLALLLTYLPGRRPGPALLLGGCLAAYGLCELLQFINRSHYFNLYHTCVPAFTIWAAWLAGAEDLAARSVRRENLLARAVAWAPTAALGFVLTVLAANPNFRNYPHVWKRLVVGESPDGLTLMPGVTGLPEDRRVLINEFQVVTRLMATFRAEGQTVGMLDPSDTMYYLASGCPPQGRYTSLITQTIHRDQLSREGDHLAALGLDVWIVRDQMPDGVEWKYVLRALTDRVTHGYVPIIRVSSFQVWRLFPGASGTGRR